MTVHQNGRLTINADGGRQYGVRANGTVSSYRDSSKSVTFNGNGRVTSFHTANMDIQRGPAGQRTIVSHLPNNTTVVSTGPHSGFVEHNVVIGNRTYVQRTIVGEISRYYSHVRLGYPYGGIVLNRFVAPVYFDPVSTGGPMMRGAIRFLTMVGDGWAIRGIWVRILTSLLILVYSPGAAFWLTDYMLGQTLQAAYQVQANAALDNSDADYSADASAPSQDDSDTLAAVANTAGDSGDQRPDRGRSEAGDYR